MCKSYLDCDLRYRPLSDPVRRKYTFIAVVDIRVLYLISSYQKLNNVNSCLYYLCHKKRNGPEVVPLCLFMGLVTLLLEPMVIEAKTISARRFESIL